MCSLVHIVLYLYKYIEVVSTCILLTLVKFAENMALVARLQHFLQIDVLNSRFKESFLVLNVSKTKELVFDSRKENESFKSAIIDQQSVDVVSGTWTQL